MSFTSYMTYVAGSVLTAAQMNTYVRDNGNAIVGGMVGTGFPLIDMLGAASDPSVSAAGHAVIAYNTTNKALRASLNAGRFNRVGTPPYADPSYCGGTAFGAGRT